MPDSAVESHPSHDEPWRIPAAAHGAVAILILGVTCASLHFFYTRGLSNLYGDGLAHMEGARRIFDSLTPGYEEIGSVWLPLYHLICAPLAANDFLWRTGLAGGLVSSAAFALTCYLLFRLGAEINRNLAAGLVALAGALMCPSFLYLASTPLTEPLALLWAVLVAYALFRYSQSGSWKSLAGAAVAAFMGTLTRYEGWNVLPFATLLILLIHPYPWRQRFVRAAFFTAVAGTGPLLWLIHNAHRFQNPLEFYNGLGSAKDIYAHQVATTAFLYPTDGSLLLSARYYLEDLKLVIGIWALELAVLGLVAWGVSWRESRRGAVAVLLIVPLPFYIQAMAYAAVPLYVPTLFPNTYYNLRYGVEMIAAVALFPSFVFPPLLGKRLRLALLIIFLALLGRQFAVLTAAGPRELPVVKEGILNTPCRAQRQRAIIEFLRGRYDGGRILVAVGKWPCVMPEVGIYFRNTLTNQSRRFWAQMHTEPEKWVEWIIRGDGDAIDSLMRAYPQAFKDYEVVDQGEFPGEGGFKIYRRRKM
ncbi:MAG TPA: glycosyltransferase family 39 protein [Terriglobia bacterium]|nr:glycosyltransferase family 39 protein [Terriglobia bacterium]